MEKKKSKDFGLDDLPLPLSLLKWKIPDAKYGALLMALALALIYIDGNYSELCETWLTDSYPSQHSPHAFSLFFVLKASFTNSIRKNPKKSVH